MQTIKLNQITRFNRSTCTNQTVYSVAVYSGNIDSTLGQPVGTPMVRYKSLLREYPASTNKAVALAYIKQAKQEYSGAVCHA